METILILGYTVWAIYSGYKVISGRSEWLDKQKPFNILVKIVLSIFVGYIIAGFYLIYLVFKFLGLMSRM